MSETPSDHGGPAAASVIDAPANPSHHHTMNDNENPAPGNSEAAPTDRPESTDGAPTEGQGDRKRRRRRGGRGRNKGGPRPEGGDPSQANLDSYDAEGQGDNEPSANGAAPTNDRPPREDRGPRDRRDGRGRGPRRDDRPHRGPDRGPDNDRPQADHAAEPKPRREPREVKPKTGDWEEIFEGKTFADIGLRNSVVKGCEAAGFKHPTKIQADLIPLVISGRDVLGQSRTGTGKTAAFGLPLFHMAQRQLPFQSIILAPTRELAIQIASELEQLGKFTPIKVSAVYGGQNVATQARHLQSGPEIIVATPGRLLDMKERGHITFDNIKFIILDEVDRMLDIGFRDDIRRILSQIKSEHQTVFVSATISEEIEKLARQYMKNPEKLVTTGSSLTVSLVEQYYIAVQPWDKRAMLHYVLTHEDPDLTVIFCRMKRTVDEVAKYLTHKGIDAHAIHGDMYQGKRNSVMKMLRAGQLGVLVASDLAARGLDVDGISHVVNYDVPEDPEVYIHRIGRTARGGRNGVAWSLVTPDQGELLTAIEMLANTHIPEKTYPGFQPGPIPDHIRAERQREQHRIDHKKSQGSRFGPSALPPGVGSSGGAVSGSTGGTGGSPASGSNAGSPSAGASASSPKPVSAASIDPARFPGGIVPTKLPPKMLGGRVKTSRSMKAPPPPSSPPPAPPANP